MPPHLGAVPRAVLATVVSLVAACTPNITGTAVTAPAERPDLHLLDTGNYPTKPSPPMGLAGPPEQGALIESQRLASYVTGPWEVDPRLINQSLDSAVMLWNPVAIKFALGEHVAGVTENHRVVAGFFSVRGDGENNLKLENTVLRFASMAEADAAAADLNGSLSGGQPGAPPEEQTSIPGHDGTRAIRGTRQAPLTGTRQVADAYTVRGGYLLIQRASSRDGAGLVELIGRTLDLQAPLIDDFEPTVLARLADVPIDPTGLLAKTLPIAPADALPLQRTVYQQRGALHLASDPVTRGAMFRDTGTTLMSFADATVYETRDPGSADRLGAAGFEGPDILDSQSVDGVANLPESECAELKVELAAGPRKLFGCLVSAGRYLVEVTSSQLRDAHQKTAAQYAMLMGP